MLLLCTLKGLQYVIKTELADEVLEPLVGFALHIFKGVGHAAVSKQADLAVWMILLQRRALLRFVAAKQPPWGVVRQVAQKRALLRC